MLSSEDARLMKKQLQLRNKIIDAEKNYEREMAEENAKMDEEVRKLDKKGKEKIKEGDTTVTELAERTKALKNIERKKAIYELELFEWAEQCRKMQDAITNAKYENSMEMARKKIEYDRELDDLKKTTNTDADKFIDEIEREIHVENQKLTIETVKQREDINKFKKEIAILKDTNIRFKRDLNLNTGTEEEYTKRAVMQA